MTHPASVVYALITTKRVATPVNDYRTHWRTCGHRDPNCRAISPASGQLPTTTLGEYMMDNEYFDDEVVYFDPFQCHVCHDLCRGGTCHSILEQCSKHSAAYQRRFGRAANE